MVHRASTHDGEGSLSLDPLLRLSSSAEEEFWSDPSTNDRVLLYDKVALVLGATLHALSALFKPSWPLEARAGIWLGGAMQVVQLCWALCSSSSYTRHRRWATIAQRLRWLLVVPVLQAHSDAEHLFIMQPSAQLGGPAAYKALLQLILLFSTPPVFLSLVHPAPFRHAVLFSAGTLVQHVVYGLPHQLQALDMHGLRPLVPPACAVAHALLDPSALSLGPGAAPALCSAERASFFLVFSYLLVAAVVPLTMGYWSERGAKEAWLRRRPGQEAAGAPGGLHRRPGKALMLWVSCAASWSLLSMASGLLLGW
jgi:hypothetical protein